MTTAREANKHAGTSSVVSPTFGYSMAHNLLGEEPPQNVTLEHIQRLEDDLALKDQEIQASLLANPWCIVDQAENSEGQQKARVAISGMVFPS